MSQLHHEASSLFAYQFCCCFLCVHHHLTVTQNRISRINFYFVIFVKIWCRRELSSFCPSQPKLPQTKVIHFLCMQLTSFFSCCFVVVFRNVLAHVECLCAYIHVCVFFNVLDNFYFIVCTGYVF